MVLACNTGVLHRHGPFHAHSTWVSCFKFVLNVKKYLLFTKKQLIDHDILIVVKF